MKTATKNESWNIQTKLFPSLLNTQQPQQFLTDTDFFIINFFLQLQIKMLWFIGL